MGIPIADIGVVRYHFWMKGITLSASAMFVLVGSSASAAVSTRIASVWAQERAYWQATIRQDDAIYQALWHPAFLGWPCDEKRPVSALPPRVVRDGVNRSYVMDEQAATEKLGLVSTFYHVRERDERQNGKVDFTDYNITHTWVPTQQGWRIISGMCKYPEVAR